MTVPARITFVTLGARDVPALAGFYQRIGFEPIVETPDFTCFRLRGALLGLFGRDLLAQDAQVPREPDGSGGMRGFAIAINVDERDEVDRVIEEVRAAGARITKEPVDSPHFTGRTAYFADPEDNYWEVAWLPFDDEVSVAIRQAAGLKD